jgi:hypothetical protein
MTVLLKHYFYTNELTTSATGHVTAVPFHSMPHSLAMQPSVYTNHVYVIQTTVTFELHCQTLHSIMKHKT